MAVVYFRKEHGGGCVWPPSSTEGLNQTQQLQNWTLQEAAARYGVELNLPSGRVTDLTAVITQVEQSKLDGLIAVGTDFDVRPWIEFCE